MAGERGQFEWKYKDFPVREERSMVFALNLAKDRFFASGRRCDAAFAVDEILTYLREYLEEASLLFEDSISPFELTGDEMVKINTYIDDLKIVPRIEGKNAEKIGEFYAKFSILMREAITRKARENIKIELKHQTLPEIKG